MATEDDLTRDRPSKPDSLGSFLAQPRFLNTVKLKEDAVGNEFSTPSSSLQRVFLATSEGCSSVESSKFDGAADSSTLSGALKRRKTHGTRWQKRI